MSQDDNQRYNKDLDSSNILKIWISNKNNIMITRIILIIRNFNKKNIINKYNFLK